eukprot:TRINITY_DN75034_c0_g1_i1.p1 TRINITY_DN75034_c0_g1~~TRINITY_DN75034_c0_g1_i1.p1  ORF type:complete len:105 (+),score=1.29 TRINITY_DN75034_c0_g1_i1:25-339(+)
MRMFGTTTQSRSAFRRGVLLLPRPRVTVHEGATFCSPHSVAYRSHLECWQWFLKSIDPREQLRQAVHVTLRCLVQRDLCVNLQSCCSRLVYRWALVCRRGPDCF